MFSDDNQPPFSTAMDPRTKLTSLALLLCCIAGVAVAQPAAQAGANPGQPLANPGQAAGQAGDNPGQPLGNPGQAAGAKHGKGGKAATATSEKLKEGFYEQSCPKAEEIVRDSVKEAVAAHAGCAPGLIRLLFHDCFVRGCDASILLDQTPGAPPVEKESQANLGLRGFEAINNAKTRLEDACPNTVSCADIIAFAARDASVLLGAPSYPVVSGRRDGVVSVGEEIPGNLPLPFSRDVNAMTSIFKKKGMDTEDLVALLGTHSVGRIHCKLITPQIQNNDTKSWDADLGIDPDYVNYLRMRCGGEAKPTDGNVAVVDGVMELNPVVVPGMKPFLSNVYYLNVLKNKAVLLSDRALENDSSTLPLVNQMAADNDFWMAKYTVSMQKLGKVEVLTGKQGQIRKYCNQRRSE